MLCAKANKMFMQTVQQIVFLILKRVPVTFVTDSGLIRPSIPVMTHSLDQKVMARKAKARKCTAKIVGNIQAKEERQHMLMMSFFVIPPSRDNPHTRYTKMCVTHNSAGMVSLMWCQIFKFSPAPINIYSRTVSSNRLIDLRDQQEN